MTDIYSAFNKSLMEISSVQSNKLGAGNGVRPNPSQCQKLFWGTQQRVFKQLLVSQKVNRAVEIAREAAKRKSQVVISLWSTGESRTAEKIKELKEGGRNRLSKVRVLFNSMFVHAYMPPCVQFFESCSCLHAFCRRSKMILTTLN